MSLLIKIYIAACTELRKLTISNNTPFDSYQRHFGKVTTQTCKARLELSHFEVN